MELPQDFLLKIVDFLFYQVYLGKKRQVIKAL